MESGGQTGDRGPETTEEGLLAGQSSLAARHLSRRRARLAGVALLLVCALLYLLTLDNGLRPGELLGGDLITHQYAQAEGRFSNAPGYPLYTMGGWLWFRLGRALGGPEANPVPILSSYSTLWALAALGLLYALILEITRRPDAPDARAGGPQDSGNWPVALLVTAFYGVTYFFWYYAVTTEQYTSSVAWTLAVFWLAFRWERQRGASGTRGRRDGYLLGMALLAGVALAHQLTLPIIFVPLLWFVLSVDPGVLRPRLIAAAVGLALLPLLSYAYVYAGGALHPEWRGDGSWASTWEWFWSFVSTRQGRAELTWSWTPFVTDEFPALIWRELTVPGLLAGLLGWAALGRRRALLLYASLALYLGLCWIDRLGNWYQVIMPMYALLGLGIAAGADWLMREAGAWEERRRGGRERAGAGAAAPRGARPHSVTQWLVLLSLIALLCLRALFSAAAANQRNRPDDTGLNPGWAILADDPPAGAAIFATLPEQAALNYLTRVWGQRPDLNSVTGDEARARFEQGAALAATRAILPLAPQEIAAVVRYHALGRTLAALQREPDRTVPDGLRPWSHDFGAEIRLLGGAAGRNPATDELVVRLAWQTQGKPREDWAVSVRLTQQGREIAQVDAAHPVFGAHPTSRWLPGEVVLDAYPFKLPDGAAPDGVKVILYRQTSEGGFANLDVATFPLPSEVEAGRRQ